MLHAAAVTFKWSTTAAGLEGFESWSDAKMDFVMPKGTAWPSSYMVS